VHPFVNYEMAKGVVEERRATSERRNRWRRAENETVPPLPSWDAEMIELQARQADGEPERIGA